MVRACIFQHHFPTGNFASVGWRLRLFLPLHRALKMNMEVIEPAMRAQLTHIQLHRYLLPVMIPVLRIC